MLLCKFMDVTRKNTSFPLGYRKIEELEISDAKIDRNISDLTLILVNILLGLVRLG